jgi:hypothetical protein
MMDVQDLAAREAIRDCLYRYCRGIDRADAEMLRSAYWPDGVDDHVLFNGNAYEFVDWCLPLLAQVEHSQHVIMNALIALDGDTAGVESHYHAYERRRRASGSPYEMFVGGRYLDRFERRGGEWRILHRAVTWDWFRHFKDSADLDRGVFGNGPVRMGGKWPDDPSYGLFGSGKLKII